MNIPPAKTFIAGSADETFALGETIGRSLEGGELVLLTGGLGAGKTVFTKGILSAMGLDPDEVTSPSFTLVNLYRARLPVYHIDLWRLDESTDAAMAVGLDDILAEDNAVIIVEWAEKFGEKNFEASTIRVTITGDGDQPREITVAGSSAPSSV